MGLLDSTLLLSSFALDAKDAQNDHRFPGIGAYLVLAVNLHILQ